MTSLKYLTLSLISLVFATTVFAQTASDSANPLRDSVKQQVEEELSQIKKAVSKKAFLGSITSKNEAAINISSYLGQNRQVLVTTDTVIKLKNGREGTPKDLSVGDYLLVMGEVDSQNVMTSKRLLVIPIPAEDTRTVTFGKVTSVVSGSVTIESKNGKTLTVKTQSSTKVTKTVAGASAKAKLADITTNTNIVLISKASASVTASDIHILGSASGATAAP